MAVMVRPWLIMAAALSLVLLDKARLVMYQAQSLQQEEDLLLPKRRDDRNTTKSRIRTGRGLGVDSSAAKAMDTPAVSVREPTSEAKTAVGAEKSVETKKEKRKRRKRAKENDQEESPPQDISEETATKKVQFPQENQGGKTAVVPEISSPAEKETAKETPQETKKEKRQRRKKNNKGKAGNTTPDTTNIPPISSSTSTSPPANLNIDKSWRPTKEWLTSCATELAQNKTLLVPFHSWRNAYGLGDCIKMCARCMSGERNSKDQNLAKRYRRKACYMDHPNYVSGGNLTVVEKLLTEWEQQQDHPPHPSPEALIIHLRVGDVIEKSEQSTEELLMSGGDPWHTGEYKSSIKSVGEYLDNIRDSNSTHVVIMGGAFKRDDYLKSRVYAGCLERAIRQAGYFVEMDLDAPDADADFYFMTHAKKLVVSAGGYSTLIAKLVTRNGGQIIGRTFDDPHGVRNYEINNWGAGNVLYWDRKHAKDNGLPIPKNPLAVDTSLAVKIQAKKKN